MQPFAVETVAAQALCVPFQNPLRAHLRVELHAPGGRADPESLIGAAVCRRQPGRTWRQFGDRELVVFDGRNDGGQIMEQRVFVRLPGEAERGLSLINITEPTTQGMNTNADMYVKNNKKVEV
jgi:hypothetical protein